MVTFNKMALACALVLTMPMAAHAHHTYSHQVAGKLHLITTSEVQMLAMEREGQASCAYMWRRDKKRRLQYAVAIRANGCPQQLWLDVGRSKDGLYTLTPHRKSEKLDGLSGPTNFKLLSGPNYESLRAKFAISGLQLRADGPTTRQKLSAMYGAELQKQLLDIDLQSVRLKPKGFSALSASRSEDGKTTTTIVLTHEDGADGYYQSDADSAFAVVHRVEIEDGKAGTLLPAQAALEALYGTPARMERVEWPENQGVKEILTAWAVNADGTNQTQMDGYLQCGNLPLQSLRVFARNADGGRGKQITAVPAHDIYKRDDRVTLPGDCVFIIEARLKSWPNGKLNLHQVTITDAGLLTDIYNKTVFDAAHEASKGIKRPKGP